MHVASLIFFTALPGRDRRGFFLDDRCALSPSSALPLDRLSKYFHRNKRTFDERLEPFDGQ